MGHIPVTHAYDNFNAGVSSPALLPSLVLQKEGHMRSTRAFRNDESRSAEAGGQVRECSDCEPISLLAFLEKENRELRSAVIDLALDTHLLKAAQGRNKR
jgi:hypothetical protein